jgi:FMN-dependent NADH-azoreductase
VIDHPVERRGDGAQLPCAEQVGEMERGCRRDRPWNLWDGSLPEFGPAATHAKMAVFAGADPEGDQAAAWRGARATFGRFAAADQYLFSVPMWNAGIPYILKQFIDVVSQPGMVFSFDVEHGYTGLVSGRKAAVVYTSAVYGPGRPPSFGSDFQAPYLRDWLNWAGIADVTEIAFRPNLATADAESGRQAAHAAARDAAKIF